MATEQKIEEFKKILLGIIEDTKQLQALGLDKKLDGSINEYINLNQKLLALNSKLVLVQPTQAGLHQDVKLLKEQVKALTHAIGKVVENNAQLKNQAQQSSQNLSKVTEAAEQTINNPKIGGR